MWFTVRAPRRVVKHWLLTFIALLAAVTIVNVSEAVAFFRQTEAFFVSLQQTSHCSTRGTDWMISCGKQIVLQRTAVSCYASLPKLAFNLVCFAARAVKITLQVCCEFPPPVFICFSSFIHKAKQRQ